MKRERKKDQNDNFKKILKHKGTKIGLWTLGVLLALVLILFLIILPYGKIAQGVLIDGTDVSKMLKIDAKMALSPLRDMSDQEIVVAMQNGASVTFYGADIELLKDGDKTVDKAFMVGRSGNVFENIAELIRVRFLKENLSYEYSYNRSKLYDIIYNLGVSQNGELKNYTIEYSGNTAKVSLGTSGQSREIEDAVLQFEESIKGENYNISLELKKEEPKFPSAKTLYDEIYIAPKNAQYRVENGRAIMEREQVGREIDPKDAEAQIEAVKSGRTVTIKTIETMPEITVEKLNSQLFGNVLGSYSTNYATSDRGRRNNVELAARLIDNVILMPDEIFSFNKIVGRRTAKNGFLEAPVFSSGEIVQGTGGGVCQVSTTLYCAVLYSDLEIVERKNHSMTVTYVPRGQDATVSYGTIDFKFKNNTKNPIRISATSYGGKLTVSLCSAQGENKTVKIINSLVGTKKIETIEKLTDTLAPGVRKQVSEGKTGYTVDTYKKVYIDGTEVRSERVSRSVYKMVPAEVLVGKQRADGPEETKETIEDVFGEIGKGEEQEEIVSPPPVDEQPESTPPSEATHEPSRDTQNAEEKEEIKPQSPDTKEPDSLNAEQ